MKEGIGQTCSLCATLCFWVVGVSVVSPIPFEHSSHGFLAFDRSTGALNRRGADRLRNGGARRDRTDDILLAKQALSQLSYGPEGPIRWHGTPEDNGGPGKT